MSIDRNSTLYVQNYVLFFFTLTKISVASIQAQVFQKSPCFLLLNLKNGGELKAFIALASTVIHRPPLLIYLKALKALREPKSSIYGDYKSYKATFSEL